MANKGLGRGFDSLIPQNFDTAILAEEADRIQKIAVAELLPNPDQPRSTFDEQSLHELASSIQEFGILQPLIVTPVKGNKGYKIVAGERRWRAAKRAGLTHLPVIVRERKELEQLEVALVENVQRVDLSPLEQASSIARLHEQFSMSYNAIAARLGKASTTIQNMVRLLQLPQEAQQALLGKTITEGHARAILAVKDAKQQLELLTLIHKNGWSVRQAEQYVVAKKQGSNLSKKSVQHQVATVTPATKKLTKTLGHEVTIKRLAKGGKLEIRFKSEAELKNIVSKLENVKSPY